MASHPESQEVQALRLSLLLVILFAAGAILVAMYSDSETMSLEAMSAVVDIVVSGLAVFVARKVRAPANHRYQFGYAKYEPLMTTVEGVLMAGVCTGAILYSARDLLNPDPVHDAWFVVVYSAASFVVSLIFGLWMRRVGTREGSPLARAEGELWIAEGWLALGVFVAFVASIALSRIWKLDASAYVDPPSASCCRWSSSRSRSTSCATASATSSTRIHTPRRSIPWRRRRAPWPTAST